MVQGDIISEFEFTFTKMPELREKCQIQKVSWFPIFVGNIAKYTNFFFGSDHEKYLVKRFNSNRLLAICFDFALRKIDIYILGVK